MEYELKSQRSTETHVKWGGIFNHDLVTAKYATEVILYRCLYHINNICLSYKTSQLTESASVLRPTRHNKPYIVDHFRSETIQSPLLTHPCWGALSLRPSKRWKMSSSLSATGYGLYVRCVDKTAKIGPKQYILSLRLVCTQYVGNGIPFAPSLATSKVWGSNLQ